MTEQEMITEFLINHDKEETELTLSYAKRVLSLEMEIKNLKEDIKSIKQEAKDEGVSVAKVNKALSEIKKRIKAGPGELNELEMYEEALEHDPDIKTMVNELVKK